MLCLWNDKYYNRLKRYFKLTPYNALTEKDNELIDEYIHWFGPNYPDSADWRNWAGLETILMPWNNAKAENLFTMFGNELIVKRPYTYKQNLDGLSHDIGVAMENDKEYRDFNYWWNWSIKHNANVKFEIVCDDSTCTNGLFYSKFFLIESAFSSKVLAENAYTEKEYKIKFEDGTIFKVSSGMKPMKILHKFIEKYGTPEDEEMFERFRIWHSKLLNQKNVDGELCLSIHPLDYMTMSDNANKWSSCMRWTDKYGNAGDPGDYRAGTIACMNSPYIIVAYLHNKNHPFCINDWEWNNKRWRELFIINEGSITEIKGYPYQDENLTNTCLMWLKELAYNNLGWTYEDEEYNAKNAIEDNDITYYLDYIKSDYMYKDIGSLDKHACRLNKKVLFTKFKHNYYNYNANNDKTIFIDIPYGGYTSCMCCGAPIDEYDRDKAVLCDSCESVRRCNCCGNPVYNDDDLYWVDDSDEPMCYDCWCDQTAMDDLTEENHLIDNMTEIWLLKGYDDAKNPVWYREKTIFVYDPMDNWDYQNMFIASPKYLNHRYYVTADMVKEDQYKDFCRVFDISIDELYEDIYYFPNMELVYPEEEAM